MNRPSTVIRIKDSELPQSLNPTTLDKLGKYEEFLEIAIAENPSLMQLENRRTGIRKPFKIFRQLSLPTPSERLIYPDIVLLAASGHVIVVEVKLGSNPELKNRSVIAQIVDYAASFSSLSENQIVKMFDIENSGQSWDELVADWFEGESDIDELGQVLLERMNAGELNLVIACDRVPIGLPDVISGIVSVRPLGFELDLVEVTPFVTSEKDEIILVPTTRLQTEIVARTAVSVRYEQTDAKPEVAIEATGATTIIDNIKGVNDARRWTSEEVEAAVEQDGNSVEKRLLAFAKEHSFQGTFVSPAVKKRPTFGLTLAFDVAGKQETKMVFYCVIGWGGPTLNLGHLRSYAPSGVDEEFRRRLDELFGSNVNTLGNMPGIPYEYLEPKLREFLELLSWLKHALSDN